MSRQYQVDSEELRRERHSGVGLKAVGGTGKPKQREQGLCEGIITGPETEVARRLGNAWKACRRVCDCNGHEANRAMSYARMLGAVEKLEYSAEDIERFSLTLAKFQDSAGFQENAGLFLSALINNCKGETIVIHTTGLATLIDCLGYKNTKNLIVKGDAGSLVGHLMECGTITLEGNVEDRAGWKMKGGAILIKGNANGLLGESMEGGGITVEGNAGGLVGDLMMGGTITVKGNVGSLAGYMMNQGTIMIGGNAGHSLGREMYDGIIRVMGKAGEYVGWLKKGGTITVEGETGVWAGHI